MKSKSSILIGKVSRKMGAKVRVTLRERGIFDVIYKGKTITVERSFFINRSPFVGVQTTKFKDATYKILVANKIKTPKAVFFYTNNDTKAQIMAKLKRLKYPVIVKQLEGSNSKDIYPNIKTPAAGLKIVREQLAKGCRLIVQEMVYGKEYRLLVLDDQVIGALEMRPPCVKGDGQSSIKELIESKNKTLKKPVLFDDNLNQILATQGLKLSSIPAKADNVLVKHYSSLASGGETADVTDQVDAGFHEIGAQVALATGKYLCGIDLICDDIAKSPKNQKYFVLEVNGRPDLTIHYNPNYGSTQNVVEKIIKFITSSKLSF